MTCFLPDLFCVNLPFIVLELFAKCFEFLSYFVPIKFQPSHLLIQLLIDLILQFGLKNIEQMADLSLKID